MCGQCDNVIQASKQALCVCVCVLNTELLKQLYVFPVGGMTTLIMLLSTSRKKKK